jgi:hypothetical protein
VAGFSASTTTFVGLSGPSPVLTYNEFFVTDGNNQALTFEIEGSCEAFSFTKFTCQQISSPRTMDPGSKWYTPLSYAVPYGITAPVANDSETFVMFSATTTDAVDPGPIVTLIP